MQLIKDFVEDNLPDPNRAEDFTGLLFQMYCLKEEIISYH